MDFIVFGFMDNFILILGMYFSYTSVEYYLEKYLIISMLISWCWRVSVLA